jgi:hypothetical protein
MRKPLFDWSIFLAIVLLLFIPFVANAQQSVVVPATTNQISIAGTVAASTKIITGATGKQIYVTALLLAPVATSVVTFTYGTGTNCGTNTASITGAMTFAAGAVVAHGAGAGAVFVLPRGVDLCITIATAAAPGSIAYSLF